MSKTAREWQQQLGLDTLPDEEFLQALNALEGQEVIDGGGLEAQGLVAQGVHTPEALVGALVVASAGEAFKAARQRRRLTVRKAAQAWGVSPSRISQLEAPDANLYMSTIGSAARRMGYRAKLVLEPLGEGETIVAPLGAQHQQPFTAVAFVAPRGPDDPTPVAAAVGVAQRVAQRAAEHADQGSPLAGMGLAQHAEGVHQVWNGAGQVWRHRARGILQRVQVV